MGRDMTGARAARSRARARRSSAELLSWPETLRRADAHRNGALPAAAEVPAVRILLQRALGRPGAAGQGARRDATRGRPSLAWAGLTPRAGAQIMDTDPYYWTQDNGAGAPVHFATTYKQLDMVRRRCEPGRDPKRPPPLASNSASAARAAPAARRGLTRHPAPRRRPAQLHHIVRNFPETVNQRDPRGLTALHRAAFLAQYDGYLQIYEYLLVRGAPARAPQRASPVRVLLRSSRCGAAARPGAERGRGPQHPVQ